VTHALKTELAQFLRLWDPPEHVAYETLGRKTRQGYDEVSIEYRVDDTERVPAFLLLPHVTGKLPAVLVHHQHAGQRHLGKSEVAGLAGDPLHAFGPALAKRGMVVLAPDSICFEDRREHHRGTTAGPGESDWLNHYNAMAHRLVSGDTLMRRVLSDSMAALSLLRSHPLVDPARVGMSGHAYGGNTVLFHSAVDSRVAFGCASGAACSYRQKVAAGTVIELAEVIPGFAARWDVEDLVRAMAPRPMLLVSGAKDPYSKDADNIERLVRPAYEALGGGNNLHHMRDGGGHALTAERFEQIVDWLVRQGRNAIVGSR
jgi:dienelactone hydrolase